MHYHISLGLVIMVLNSFEVFLTVQVFQCTLMLCKCLDALWNQRIMQEPQGGGLFYRYCFSESESVQFVFILQSLIFSCAPPRLTLSPNPRHEQITAIVPDRQRAGSWRRSVCGLLFDGLGEQTPQSSTDQHNLKSRDLADASHLPASPILSSHGLPSRQKAGRSYFSPKTV